MKHKLGIGIAMIFSGPLILASYILVPSVATDGIGLMNEIIHFGRNRATASAIFGCLFIPVYAIAIIGLIDLLHEKKRTLGLSGAYSLIFGNILTGTFVVGVGSALMEVAFADIDSGIKNALAESIMNSTMSLTLVVGPLLIAAGSVALGIALYSASSAPKLLIFLFGLYGPILLVGYIANSPFIIISAFSAMTIALVPIGFKAC